MRSVGTSIVRSGLSAVGTRSGTLNAGLSVSSITAKLHTSWSWPRVASPWWNAGLVSIGQV